MTNSITPNSATISSGNLMPSWSRPELSRLQLKMEKARRSLHEFVVQAWGILEPETRFVDGMHIHAVCERLQAVTQGRIFNLIVNIPPGDAKSLLTAVFWPAWVWIDRKVPRGRESPGRTSTDRYYWRKSRSPKFQNKAEGEPPPRSEK